MQCFNENLEYPFHKPRCRTAAPISPSGCSAVDAPQIPESSRFGGTSPCLFGDYNLAFIKRTCNHGNSTGHRIPLFDPNRFPEADDNKRADADFLKIDVAADPQIGSQNLEHHSIFFVSAKNGVVHKELAGKNVDTKYARETFAKKYGDKNSETGYAYKLVYEGIIEGNGKLCYSYAVYEVNTSGSEPKNDYLFNYLVTIDGAFNAKTTIEH